MSAHSGAPQEFDRAYWEEHYRGADREHGHGGAGLPPNPHLLAAAQGLAPGRALDAGCGHGAEAAWLAANGWRVRAVDISAAALERARERVRAARPEAAERIEWAQADLTARPPEAAAFELVCSHYVHTAAPPSTLVETLAAAVAPGGTLLVVGHHPDDAHHADTPGAHLTPQEAASALDPEHWEVLTAEKATRQAATGHGGGIPLTDTVLRARRRG
ncbi:class I SAM-dependent methyltransferase [Streptomonospora sp. PA3]|uniref:class I SAM-dependent methyltransferase n=1 Tax=Streptomonospora sp. PA3 TaxID=2607326 RepID=UPI0012DC649B|nr:class I SAM-dependent methyltransferase [Streptomonospora sp. PA3]MUL40592.1 class I SAM-dependent methyltransferase [Streptomonospora sp. PA3]